MDRKRLALAVLVGLFVAATISTFVVAVIPEVFFDLTTEAGTPVRDIESAGVLPWTLLALAGVALFGLTFLLLRRSTRFAAVAATALILSFQGAAYAGYELWEFHETPEFCVRTCHVMEPTYLSYADPGLNLVMGGHLKNNTTTCLDCHTQPGIMGQVDLMLVSARHLWKMTTGDYDPDNLGGTDALTKVPDANCLKCHADTYEAALPEKHDRFETQCALCHDPHKPNATGYFFPEIILEKDDCSKCHEDRPKDFEVYPSLHSKVAEEDCRDCHVTHGNRTTDPKFILGCTDSGCHDQDKANRISLVGQSHDAFDVTSCQSCHGSAHNLTKPSLSVLQDWCSTCHKDRKVVDGEAHLRKPVIKTEECVACHGGEAGPSGNQTPLAAHGDLQCLTCHKEGNDKGAPVPKFVAVPQSQVSWMRDNGAGYPRGATYEGVNAAWIKVGRGTHDRDAACSDCHQPHDKARPVFPANVTCGDECHTWLGDIDQRGFPNRDASTQGQTYYRGSIAPLFLLNYTKDLDGDGRNHKIIFDKWGCNGFCHNAAMTLEISEAWGGDGTEPKGLSPSLLHGNITTCIDCHRFKSPGGGAADLHTTHIPFIQGEQSFADTSGSKEACDYCHSSGPYPANQSGGCYNCHLSGHRPETYYWGAIPEEG